MAPIDFILFAVLIGSVLLVVVLLVWYSLHWRSNQKIASRLSFEAANALYAEQTELQEELHDEGREEFEKAVSENATFIQQDVRRTTSELNGYMQQEITRTLNDELKKYDVSAGQVSQIAIDSIAKIQASLDQQHQQLSERLAQQAASLEQQHQQLSEQLAQQVASEKERLLARFEENMTEVVSHYVTAAIGNQVSVKDQLDYIIGELSENKQAIIEDLHSDS